MSQDKEKKSSWILWTQYYPVQNEKNLSKQKTKTKFEGNHESTPL